MNTIKIPAAITVVLLLSVTLLGLSFRKSTVTHDNYQSGNTTGFAVLELFTSEGCSSCPAADEVLQTISKTYKENVYLLGFHVDYWNRLGWKDGFSSAVYSERQRNYAQVFEKDGVYTPQAIVNGTEQFVGSDLEQLNRTIKKDLLAAVNIAPVISVTSVNNTAAVSYAVKQDPNLVLNIALVQLHAVTNVKNGENEGRTLSHINVVRDFKTVDASNAGGKVNLTIPAGMAAAGFKVIAYLQDRTTFKTTGAVEAIIL